METLSYIVLILLSLVGYSGGVVGRAGRGADVKPVIGDIVLVVLIWAGAVTFRVAGDMNKWLLILVGVGVSAIIGVAAVTFRRVQDTEESGIKEVDVRLSWVPKLWRRWKGFSRRMGSFQSRVLLSMFYFLIVTPFALGVKIFSDPLGIKRRVGESYWHSKAETPSGWEGYRRQF